MTPFKRITSIAATGFGIVLLVAYLMWINGSNYFFIDSSIHGNNLFVNFVVCILLFLINIFFIAGISLNCYDKKIVWITLGYLPLYMIVNMFPEHALALTMIVPFIYVSTIAMLGKESIKLKLKKILVCAILVLTLQIFEWITSLIKFNGISLEQRMDISILGKIVYSLDMFFSYTLAYVMKGGERHVGLVLENIYKRSESMVRWISTNGKSTIESCDPELIELRQKYNSLDKWQKAYAKLRMGTVLVFQYLLVAGVCLFFNDRLYEALIIIPMHLMFRSSFRTQYHSDSIAWCTTVSVFLFYVVTALTIPHNISMFFNVLVGLITATVMWLAGERQEYVAGLEEKIKQSLNKPARKRNFTDWSPGLEELINVDNDPRFTDREKSIIKLHWQRGWNLEDIAAELEVHRSTITRDLNKIRVKATKT